MEGIHGTINVVDASESSTRYATTAEADGSTDDDHEASADADANDMDSHVKGIDLIVEEVGEDMLNATIRGGASWKTCCRPRPTLRGDVLITAFAELPEPRPDTTHVDEALTNVLQNCEGMRKF